MNPTRLLPLLACLSACTYPAYQSTKVIEFELPAEDLRAVACTSHNGALAVTGHPGATQVRVRAELSVRGYSQQEADANLQLLEIGREQAGGRLQLSGKYPEAELNNRSPSFAFTLQVPAGVDLELKSHNGDVTARGVLGTLQLETHNGDIEGEVHDGRANAVSHNGDIELQVHGRGALDASFESHNGNVVLDVTGERCAAVEASTHNGSVSADRKVAVDRQNRRSLRGRLGDGTGKLSATTHNGNVVIR